VEVTGVRFENEGLGAALAGIGQFNQAVDGIGTGIGRAASSFSASEQIIIGGLRRIGEVAVNSVGFLASKLGEGVSAGFSFNNSMEQVTAQLNAFTKDGAVSADILEMIRQRAASTPFAFDEMARATAGLIPAANQGGVALESLVEKAEILAASNPAEGLEGAAFALREAVSGDFTSIIERFNLPRQYINQLKDEGVPALEIVSRAMQQMGYDTDLVSNLAQTAQGRWSTLVDTFTTVASTVTQPIFDIFSESLGRLQVRLDANMPRILDIAGAIGETLGNAVLWIADTAIPSAIAAWDAWGPAIIDAANVLIDFASSVYDYGVAFAENYAAGIMASVAFVADAMSAIGETIAYWLEPHSPPNIVPDLDRWGADAMQVYIDGWGNAQFDIFEEIGSLISSQLRSIAEQADSAIPRDGLIPMILGTRSAVAEAIEQLQETGEIGEEAYQKIRDAAGPAGETIAGMLELLVEQADATQAVEEAQAAYNAVVEEFTQKLGDLKSQRDAINESYENTPVDKAIAANEEQQRAIRDAEKRAKLQKTINDKSKSEAERRQAQLELERMALEDQRRAEEKARDEALAGIDAQIAATETEKEAAVTAAQTKLDEATAAKEAIDAEVAARQSMIAVQQEQNDLVREQVQLLEQMAKEAERAAKAGAKAGGGGAKGGARKPGAGAGGRKPTVPTIGRPQGAPEREPSRGPTLPAVPQRNRRMEELNNLQEPDVSWIGRIQGQVAGLNTEFSGLIGTITLFADTISTSKSAAADTFATIREEGGSFWEALTAGAIAGVTTFSEQLPLIGESLGSLWNTMSNWIADRLPAWIAGFGEFSVKAYGWVLDALPGLGSNLGTLAGTIFGWLAQTTVDVVPKLFALGVKFFSWVGTDVMPALPGVLATFGEAIFNFLTGFVTAVAPYLEKIGQRFVNWVSETATPFIGEKLQEFGQAIFDWVTDYVGRAKTAWAAVGTAIVDALRTGIANSWGAFLLWVDAQVAKLPQAVRDALGIHSPAATVVPSGEAVPDSLAYGMRQTMPALLGSVGAMMGDLVSTIVDYGPIISRSVADLFDIGGSIGTFASKIVDRFQREFIDPLQNLLDQTDKEAAGLGDELSNVDTERANILQAIANATNDTERANGQRRLEELEQKRNELIRKQTDLQKRQMDLQNQATQQQKQLFALEKQRQQFEMFKAQQDLLDSLKEYGLDPGKVLGGIDLGGDPAQLLEAMRRAQAAILAQLGLNFGGGEIGIGSTGGGMSALTNPPGAKATYVTNNGNTTVYNIDARGSNWTEAQFKRVIESTINSSVQGARTLRVMNA